ncbi:MAG: hypothetical protein IJW03_00930 [Clostridia bacterium]|nr:hypothetical protein [Clostridia bacterium]
MLSSLLKERNVPALRSREEMLDVIQSEMYGFMPKAPEQLSFSVEEKIIESFCAGKAVCNRVTAHCTARGKEFSFPFLATLPTAEGKHPFFIHINFRSDNPDRYQPTEEIIDNGFAVLSFNYEDVTTDDGDLTNGLAGVLYEDGKRGPADAGKLAMWAWAAQRVLDYAETLTDKLDLTRAIVCGHSRLGKTALLAAATDERFTFAYSNDSGCSGAAITRGKIGEQIRNIYHTFPFWFCENYARYINNEENMPFDQHYLIAAIAPRRVLVGSATADSWADPLSEQLACVAASSAFESGFIAPDRAAEPDEKFLSGDVGYHLRTGLHYFSREDWARLIEFVNLH